MTARPFRPTAGTLFTIGPMGAVSAFNRVGLDVGPSGTAFAYLEAAGGVPQLYTIDLATGAATLVGGIGSPEVIIDIAAQVVPPTPTPSPTTAPTAAPTASPTPAASPTPVQPAALPPTGGGRSGESDLVSSRSHWGGGSSRDCRDACLQPEARRLESEVAGAVGVVSGEGGDANGRRHHGVRRYERRAASCSSSSSTTLVSAA